MMSENKIDKIGILSTQKMFLFCGLNNPIYNVLCVCMCGNYGNLIMPRLLSLHLPLHSHVILLEQYDLWHTLRVKKLLSLSLLQRLQISYTKWWESLCCLLKCGFSCELAEFIEKFHFRKNNNEDLCRIYRKIKVMVEVWKYL